MLGAVVTEATVVEEAAAVTEAAAVAEAGQVRRNYIQTHESTTLPRSQYLLSFRSIETEARRSCDDC